MPDDELNIAVLMFIAARDMDRRVAEALAAAGFDDLTLAQMRLMQRLGPSGTRLTSLAEQAQVTKQTAGFLVDQLERAGWVERVPDPSDGRARLIRGTARARAVNAVADAAAAQVQEEWEEHLGTRRMAQLREALVRLREITDPWAPEPASGS